MILGAYLLLNLILGAILHNYEVFFREIRYAREKEIDRKVNFLIDSIRSSLSDSKLSEQEKSEIINKALEIIKQNH